MKSAQGLKSCSKIVSQTWASMQLAKHGQLSISQNKSRWSQAILDTLKVDLRIVGNSSSERSLLFVGNHVSYLDIPILMSAAEDFSFVAKEELSRWPVFGEAARQIETVFVKREHGPSRKRARESIHSAITAGQRIVIFPSGTTCVQESKPWKKGAFEIAAERNLLIQPFRLSYQPLRSVAYIDNDFFPFHLFQLGKLDRVNATLEFHPPVLVDDPLIVINGIYGVVI